MIRDVAIYGSPAGGEMNLIGGDIEMNSGFFNQVYFAMFGGNVEQSTTPDIEGERFDWWGNSLLLHNTPESQFNSETERTLRSVVLNSSGLAKINQAVEKDLQYLNVSFDSSVSITGNNRVEIYVRLNQTEDQFLFVWDAAKEEIIENRII